MILGEWKVVKVIDIKKTKDPNEPPPPPILYKIEYNGYIFKQNHVCEDKLSYCKFVDKTDKYASGILYLGKTTQFKIENDSLKIFSLSSNMWKSKKIFSLTPDTLILLNSDSTLVKYVKPVYHVNEKLSFDKIIVSSSGCFGSCSIGDIMIEKSGKVYYYGVKFNTINGYYTSNIPSSKYQEIEYDFKKSNIDTLATWYHASRTDDEEISVTFIKDGRIYKTISDYGHESPPDFFWAYWPVRFLYQQLKLAKIQKDINGYKNRFVAFENKQAICKLSDSESFYLNNLLLFHSKTTQEKFESKYKIQYWQNDTEQTIYTDGRFFRIKNKNQSITLDLGYNFLEKNDLIKKFIPKPKSMSIWVF